MGPWEDIPVVKKSTIQGWRRGTKKMQCTLYKHMEHPNQEPRFAFKAEKFFKDACSHQIDEGVCINHSPSTPGYLINSRAQYEQDGVVRLVVAHGL